MKILAMSSNYEKMLRNNFLTCLQRMETKFANEGENLMNTMDDSWENLRKNWKKNIVKMYLISILMHRLKDNKFLSFVNYFSNNFY